MKPFEIFAEKQKRHPQLGIPLYAFELVKYEVIFASNKRHAIKRFLSANKKEFKNKKIEVHIQRPKIKFLKELWLNPKKQKSFK